MRGKTLLFVMLSCLSIMLLSGCTNSTAAQGQDPANVKVELATDPTMMKAGEQGKLIAAITGMVLADDAQVAFDIRKPDNKGLPEIINAEAAGGGKFSAAKTFDQPGTYTVYIHLYQDDLHVTKLKKLEVQ
ncbi:hypothetical protein DFQ01_14531 [Paenibacillus cellulosilyticus]|uniref:Uncharacterized protein n=1 Tax=Paenibacillus cellulosilyticus TaxID=375489 RepID=A0A2V2YCA0_9BACL|nr:FixH family protein [Paenibacillus cellulosilyticus]PWV89434.1 hypothetical protein DFQ01_14531 [Paenibacillus cellulosilyticus]